MEEIEVVVSGLAIDAKSNSPVIILKEKEGERILPIWIGSFEANAIAMELAGVGFKRPLTYDLLKNMLEGLNVTVGKVIISDLKDNTYFARIFLESGQNVISVDARPSDSIALALKKFEQVPIDESTGSASSGVAIYRDANGNGVFDGETLDQLVPLRSFGWTSVGIGSGNYRASLQFEPKQFASRLPNSQSSPTARDESAPLSCPRCESTMGRESYADSGSCTDSFFLEREDWEVAHWEA